MSIIKIDCNLAKWVKKVPTTVILESASVPPVVVKSSVTEVEVIQSPIVKHDETSIVSTSSSVSDVPKKEKTKDYRSPKESRPPKEAPLPVNVEQLVYDDLSIYWSGDRFVNCACSVVPSPSLMELLFTLQCKKSCWFRGSNVYGIRVGTWQLHPMGQLILLLHSLGFETDVFEIGSGTPDKLGTYLCWKSGTHKFCRPEHCCFLNDEGEIIK